MPTLDVLTRPVPYRALVVDDEPTICQLLVRLLEAAGWVVATASRWQEAKVIIEDRSQPLDLLLIDQKLPDGNGMDLIPIAHGRRVTPDIVVITAWQDEEMLLKALRLGVLDFLHKPFGTADIGNMLRARTIRERQKLGIIGGEFDRVDWEIHTVHQDLADIKAILESWQPGIVERQKERRAGGTGAGGGNG